MPLLPATVTAAPQGQVKPAASGRVGVTPFARAAQRHVEQGNVVTNITVNTPAPGTFNFAVPSYGYLCGIFVTISGTGGTGGSAVFYEDAPWSIIANLLVQDVNGSPIWGPFSGYQAFLCSKYGGYRYFGPDVVTAASDTGAAPAPFAQAVQYGPATPTATGNTPLFFTNSSANWNFILPIWFTFGTGNKGALVNNDASSRYQVQITLNTATAAANVGPFLTTAPATTYPTANIAVEAFCVAEPLAADIFGNQNSTEPPAAGSIQYWTQQTFSNLSGAQTIQLSRVGNILRNHILVFRDVAGATPTRTQAELADMPPVIQFDWDSLPRYIEFTGTARMRQYQVSGRAPTPGVVVYENTSDPEMLMGAERGDYWMTTVGATKLVLRFTPANTVNLIVLSNDIVATSGEVYAAA